MIDSQSAHKSEKSSTNASAPAQDHSSDDALRESQTFTSEDSAILEDHLSGENAFDLIRGSVVSVLDSVVREYEPQIAAFTSNIAHEAVDRGVGLAQTAIAQVRRQSWLRIGIAAALGVGIIAVLSYEAAEAGDSSEASGETKSRNRKAVH